MFTRRRFLTTAAVFTSAAAAPRLLFAQTAGDDLTSLNGTELRSRLRKAESAEERRRIRDELGRRASGGKINQKPAAEQPATETGAGEAQPAPEPAPSGQTPSAGRVPALDEIPSAKKQLTPSEQSEFKARMRAAQTAEEKRAVRDEYQALARQRAHQQGKGAVQSGGKGKGGSGTQGKPQDEAEELLLLPQGKGKKKKK